MNSEQVALLREGDDGRPVIIGFARGGRVRFEAEEIEPVLPAISITFPDIAPDIAGEVTVPARRVRQVERLAALHGHRLCIFDDSVQP